MTNPDNAGGLPLLQFAVFDEFGKGADDRVWDYGRLCFEAGRELCRAAPAGGDRPWLPIDSAPKDGSYILASDGEDDGCAVVRWDCDGWCYAWHQYDGPMQMHSAAYWQALPSAPSDADGGRMSDELFTELELSVKQADEIIRSDKGCGACGDGCSDRGSCRLTDESPSAERCQKCHGTLEVLTNYAEPWSASAYSPCPDCHPAAKKDSAPAGSGEVEDWMVELFDEVYEREWNRAADEADDRHKAIIGPADRHATREAIAALLRKLSTAGSGEVEARDAYSRIIKALAAIACVHTPDDLFDLNAIPRDPVMLQVMRIRQAADDLSALLRKLQQGADENSLRAVAKRNLRSLINIGSDDKALMLKCLEELS